MSSNKRNPYDPGSWRHNISVPILAPCTVRVDKEKNNIRDASSSEIFECCTSKCQYNHQYCNDTCKNDLKRVFADVPMTYVTKMGRCKGNCRIMNDLCIQDCRGLTPGFSLDNYYYNCAAENGCPRGLGELPDKKCVENNKDVILNCCRSRCHPTDITNCEELCQTLERTILNPESIGIPKDMYPWARAVEQNVKLPYGAHYLDTKKKLSKSITQSKAGYNRGSILYIPVGIAIGLATLTILIIIITKKHK